MLAFNFISIFFSFLLNFPFWLWSVFFPSFAFWLHNLVGRIAGEWLFWHLYLVASLWLLYFWDLLYFLIAFRLAQWLFSEFRFEFANENGLHLDFGAWTDYNRKSIYLSICTSVTFSLSSVCCSFFLSIQTRTH